MQPSTWNGRLFAAAVHLHLFSLSRQLHSTIWLIFFSVQTPTEFSFGFSQRHKTHTIFFFIWPRLVLLLTVSLQLWFSLFTYNWIICLFPCVLFSSSGFQCRNVLAVIQIGWEMANVRSIKRSVCRRTAKSQQLRITLCLCLEWLGEKCTRVSCVCVRVSARNTFTCVVKPNSQNKAHWYNSHCQLQNAKNLFWSHLKWQCIRLSLLSK